ncbi:RNA polymerase sigma-70 factor [Pedobacter sp. BS3]|uniref:RNA polymerase sigma factor n=1 Tax=Pedobacter sp. BS3 TaxID=2567937 RepID=UPI0011EDCDF1|nr:RNA polymerase sigma-70 factor [Pedobacter sp. BS3]TZF81485.1 RNA polymerase sigma-70 factor [Pedobacter sp. BS3]
MVNAVNDSELIQLLASGNDAALTAIFRRYWSPLFTAAYNVLKDKQACEDIIQELFIRIWDKRDKLHINISLKAYLFAAVRYEVYRQIKSGKVRDEIFDRLTEQLITQPDYGNIEHRELVHQINMVIEKLPPKCREVYLLSREEHLSHKEIAARLNISTKTVENHLTKALQQVRLSLNNLPTLIVMLNLLFQSKK